MSIEALILGKMQARAEQRTSKAGRPFVTAKARAAFGEGESVFINVICFSESAGAALLALDAGDAVALAGTLKPGAWTDRDGNARPSLDMVAAAAMTAYGLKQKRAAAQAERQQAAPVQHPPGDDFGHNDEWLAGGAHAG